jgi:hypothetical protein
MREFEGGLTGLPSTPQPVIRVHDDPFAHSRAATVTTAAA